MSKKLKLTNLSETEMKKVSGLGSCVTPNCGCACWWEGTPDGSSTGANCGANDKGHRHSPEMNPRR